MLERIRIILWFIEDILRGKTTLLGGKLRSSGWYQFRKIHIKKNCECCGAKGKLLQPLQLHHIESFATNPALELDPNNVITLCWYCHFVHAHFRNYKSINENIREDSAILLAKIKNRPTWNGVEWLYPDIRTRSEPNK